MSPIIVSSLDQQPDVSASTPTPAPRQDRSRSAFRLGLTGWILILSLIALNIGVLFETIEWDKHIFTRILYTLDPRHWPVWPSGILWGIVAWKFNNVLKQRFVFIDKRQSQIKPGIVIVTLLYICWLAGWTGLRFYKQVYGLYMLHIVGPGAEYAITGTLSWKLLIAPMLAVMTIASLLYVAYIQRKKRNESTIEHEKRGNVE